MCDWKSSLWCDCAPSSNSGLHKMTIYSDRRKVSDVPAVKKDETRDVSHIFKTVSWCQGSNKCVKEDYV